MQARTLRPGDRSDKFPENTPRRESVLAPELIDAAELARMLSVSKPTIWRFRQDGKLPPAIALTSQCIRWRRDIVTSWINAGCPVLTTTTTETCVAQ